MLLEPVRTHASRIPPVTKFLSPIVLLIIKLLEFGIISFGGDGTRLYVVK